jgi:RNA polymerase sigma-70 factor (ECF subfamily)
MANVPKSEGFEEPVTTELGMATSLPGVGRAAAQAGATAPADGAARRGEDRELVRKAQHGDKEAFEVLVEKHQGRVFAVAGGILRNQEDVEDVAQQVFMKAYFSLKRFDQRAAFSTWLYKITVNECWDLLRKRKVRPLVFESELTEEQAHRYQSAGEQKEEALDVSEQLEMRQQVESWLRCLEERDRAMLVLKEIQGFTVEEIAEMMEINENTAKVRLFRARQKIAERMRKKRAAKA